LRSPEPALLTGPSRGAGTTAGEQPDRAHPGEAGDRTCRRNPPCSYPALRVSAARRSHPRASVHGNSHGPGETDAALAGTRSGVTMTDAIVRVAGQHLHLLAERAALWKETTTLIVADTHWGKAATFRAAGLAVPSGTTAEGLARLEAALARTSARRLVFLGDFLHAREGRVPGTLRALARWREAWSELE